MPSVLAKGPRPAAALVAAAELLDVPVLVSGQLRWRHRRGPDGAWRGIRRGAAFRLRFHAAPVPAQAP